MPTDSRELSSSLGGPGGRGGRWKGQGMISQQRGESVGRAWGERGENVGRAREANSVAAESMWRCPMGASDVRRL